MVDLRVGKAVDTLPQLQGPFDLIFIDADKPSNPDYYGWAMKLARVGTIIVMDNVVRNGAVVDAHSIDANVRGVRAANELIAADQRVTGMALQTVGCKGWDGFTLLRVNAL